MSYVDLSRLGQSALDLAAARGFKVVPVWPPADGTCTCGRDACTSAGKHPIITGWTVAASGDPTTIASWWDGYPDASVGIATGAASNLIVLDIDPRHGGDLSLHHLMRQKEFPSTLCAATGGGGQHMYYTASGVDTGNGALANGIDLRGTGGLVIAPPSVHASGYRYMWNSDPATTPIAPLPTWISDEAAARDESVSIHQANRTERRELSPAMRLLLKSGDNHNRYQSRSEVEQAIAAGAWCAGWEFYEFCDAILDPNNEGGRKSQGLPPSEQLRYLGRSWLKASKLSGLDDRSDPSVEQVVASARDWIERQNWAGRTGSFDLQVAKFVLEVVSHAGKTVFGLAARQVADNTGMNRQTASKCLIRLRSRGFITLVTNSIDEKPAVYALNVMHEQPIHHTGRMY